jgi:succinate-semialdehyde dehydrogenase/glutarate-semialdehyde dehydrogenase
MGISSGELYIAGELRAARSGRRRDVICPATEESVAEVAWADADDAGDALEASQEAFAGWSQTPIQERAEWMRTLAAAVADDLDRLRECIMLEMGKPWEATLYDARMLQDCLEFFAEALLQQREEMIPDRTGEYAHCLVRQPVGPVVALLAWNFPLLNVGYKVAPAIAAGCTITVKPSSHSPLSALAFGEICEQVGMPPGVINVVSGSGSQVGEALVSSPIPRLITLIGSSETGRRLVELSAGSVKKFSLELGGNAPVLVFADADVARAARQIAELKFANAGQICVSPNRIFAHESVLDEFVDGASAVAGGLRIGSGLGVEADMGPMVSAEARERVAGLVEDAIAEGAELVTGGRVPEGFETGYYYAPTILRNVSPQMRVAREEIFGPVMPVIAFGDEDDVVAMANDTEYGLAAYVYTTDLARGLRVPERLRFGNVSVNGPKYEVYLPHGGTKESGIGKDCSHLSLEEYSYVKRISIRLPAADPEGQ